MRFICGVVKAGGDLHKQFQAACEALATSMAALNAITKKCAWQPIEWPSVPP